MPRTDKCPSCGMTDFDEDDYEKICTSCGHIVSSDFTVSELQFTQAPNGRTSMVGQMVSHDENPPGIRGIGRPSTDVSIKKVKELIKRAGNVMEPRLTESQCDEAFMYYKIAKKYRMVHHRQHVLVAGACIYIACRLNDVPAMLLDVSEAVNADVFKLGKMFKHIARGLYLYSRIGIVDPCLYVERFANKLELGDKTLEVCRTALKLVRGMKKDWIDCGRKPSGLCGAALLVAARKHDFHRTMTEMIRVVKVCKKTLRKRLLEFEVTPSGSLTIDEFDTVAIEQLPEQLPPSFAAARAQEQEAEKPDEETAAEIKDMQREIDESTAPKDDMYGAYASYIGEGMLSAAEAGAVFTSPPPASILAAIGTIGQQNPEEEVEVGVGELDLRGLDEEELDLCAEEEVEVGDGELDLRGLDDEELDKMLLTADEVRVKTQEWEKEYQQFVEEQEERRKKQEEHKAKKKGKSKLRRPRVRSPQRGEAASAAEAVKNVIIQKGLANRFNMDEIQSYFTPSSFLPQNGDEQPHGSQQSGSSSQSQSQSPVQSSASKRKASDALKALGSSSKKKKSNGLAEESEEMDEAASSRAQADPTVLEVVDETGMPINYAEEEEEEEVDEYDNDFDFDEDNPPKNDGFDEYNEEEDDGDDSDYY